MLASLHVVAGSATATASEPPPWKSGAEESSLRYFRVKIRKYDINTKFIILRYLSTLYFDKVLSYKILGL
jgi:hypothetical protein